MVSRSSTDPQAVLRAFAEPTRLSILALLEAGEVCVCDLVTALDLPQPTVSRHLAVLRRAGWVEARRQGTWMWYRLAVPGCALQRKLSECLAICTDELPGLAATVRCCTRLRASRACC